MSAQGKFIIFCAEQYKAAKHLTGNSFRNCSESIMFGNIFTPALRHCIQQGQIILLRI